MPCSSKLGSLWVVDQELFLCVKLNCATKKMCDQHKATQKKRLESCRTDSEEALIKVLWLGGPLGFLLRLVGPLWLRHCSFTIVTWWKIAFSDSSIVNGGEWNLVLLYSVYNNFGNPSFLLAFFSLGLFPPLCPVIYSLAGCIFERQEDDWQIHNLVQKPAFKTTGLPAVDLQYHLYVMTMTMYVLLLLWGIFPNKLIRLQRII